MGDGTIISRSVLFISAVSLVNGIVIKRSASLADIFLGKGSLCGGNRITVIPENVTSEGAGLTAEGSFRSAAQLKTDWLASVTFGESTRIKNFLFGGRNGAPCAEIIGGECTKVPPIHQVPDPQGGISEAVSANLDIRLPVFVEIEKLGKQATPGTAPSAEQGGLQTRNFIEVGHYNYSAAITPYVVDYNPKRVVGDDILQIQGNKIGRSMARIGPSTPCVEIHESDGGSPFLAPRSDLVLTCKVGKGQAVATLLEVVDPKVGNACFLPKIERSRLTTVPPQIKFMAVAGEGGGSAPLPSFSQPIGSAMVSFGLSTSGGPTGESEIGDLMGGSQLVGSVGITSQAAGVEDAKNIQVGNLTGKLIKMEDDSPYNPLVMPIVVDLRVDNVHKKVEVVSSDPVLLEAQGRLRTYGSSADSESTDPARVDKSLVVSDFVHLDDGGGNSISAKTGISPAISTLSIGTAGTKAEVQFEDGTGLATGSFGGGNFIQISGQGFSAKDSIYLCGQPCRTQATVMSLGSGSVSGGRSTPIASQVAGPGNVDARSGSVDAGSGSALSDSNSSARNAALLTNSGFPKPDISHTINYNIMAESAELHEGVSSWQTRICETPRFIKPIPPEDLELYGSDGTINAVAGSAAPAGSIPPTTAAAGSSASAGLTPSHEVVPVLGPRALPASSTMPGSTIGSLPSSLLPGSLGLSKADSEPDFPLEQTCDLKIVSANYQIENIFPHAFKYESNFTPLIYSASRSSPDELKIVGDAKVSGLRTRIFYNENECRNIEKVEPEPEVEEVSTGSGSLPMGSGSLPAGPVPDAPSSSPAQLGSAFGGSMRSGSVDSVYPVASESAVSPAGSRSSIGSGGWKPLPPRVPLPPANTIIVDDSTPLAKRDESAESTPVANHVTRKEIAPHMAMKKMKHGSPARKGLSKAKRTKVVSEEQRNDSTSESTGQESNVSDSGSEGSDVSDDSNGDSTDMTEDQSSEDLEEDPYNLGISLLQVAGQSATRNKIAVQNKVGGREETARTTLRVKCPGLFTPAGRVSVYEPGLGYAYEGEKGMLDFEAYKFPEVRVRPPTKPKPPEPTEPPVYEIEPFNPMNSYASRFCQVSQQCPPGWQCCPKFQNEDAHCAPICLNEE